MKSVLILLTLALTCTVGRASLYTFNNINLTIPEGNPVGVATVGIVTGFSGNATDFSVTLNVSGGYDAGLYAYLVAPNGAMTLLLNQPGVTPQNPFGNATSGLNLTLADGAPAITASSDLMNGGTYAAVGNLNATFSGALVNGDWTLFFANTVSGSGDATLNGWSLNITAVPEPANLALGLFAATAIAAGGIRRLWRKQRQLV